jgi:carbohydrate-selective porin OprB
MIMGELNYDFYPTPWFDIMPNFQYIINTDGLGFGLKNYPKKNLPNTYIIGLQFQVNWPAVLGLSKFN